MDELVKQAMAKWPNVPHCYGWLALDARGHWRMRDQPTQDLNLPGDKIAHVALLAFINRNYLHDERGCWFFQNGPQRVYLNLEATPFIARTDGAQGFVLHTGAPMAVVDEVFLCDSGELILRHGEVVAQLDDRDMAQVMAMLRIDGKPVDDDALMAWLEGAPARLVLRGVGFEASVQHLRHETLAQQFGFVQVPSVA
jgi:hypothetical protein